VRRVLDRLGGDEGAIADAWMPTLRTSRQLRRSPMRKQLAAAVAVIEVLSED
jgi:hypothetical protein